MIKHSGFNPQLDDYLKTVLNYQQDMFKSKIMYNEKTQRDIDIVRRSVTTPGMLYWVDEFVPGREIPVANLPELNYRLDSFERLGRLQKIYTHRIGSNFCRNTLIKEHLILSQYRSIYKHTFLMQVYYGSNFGHNCTLLRMGKGFSELDSFIK